jgi:hypothetical protein
VKKHEVKKTNVYPVSKFPFFQDPMFYELLAALAGAMEQLKLAAKALEPFDDKASQAAQAAAEDTASISFVIATIGEKVIQAQQQGRKTVELSGTTAIEEYIRRLEAPKNPVM